MGGEEIRRRTGKSEMEKKERGRRREKKKRGKGREEIEKRAIFTCIVDGKFWIKRKNKCPYIVCSVFAHSYVYNPLLDGLAASSEASDVCFYIVNLQSCELANEISSCERQKKRVKHTTNAPMDILVNIRRCGRTSRDRRSSNVTLVLY